MAQPRGLRAMVVNYMRALSRGAPATVDDIDPASPYIDLIYQK